MIIIRKILLFFFSIIIIIGFLYFITRYYSKIFILEKLQIQKNILFHKLGLQTNVNIQLLFLWICSE